MTDIEQRLLLLVGNDPDQWRLVTSLAARDGWRTLVAPSAGAAVDMLEDRATLRPGAMVVDLPNPEAVMLVSRLHRLRPLAPILALTGDAAPRLAIDAIRAGAADFVTKPASTERMLHSLRLVVSRDPCGDELSPLTEKLPSSPDFEAMIGAAPMFRAALAVAAKAARGNGAVLIDGERGTGKEMLARAMHAASMRAKAPLRTINLGCVPANSIESILFGHEKDAFPGAFSRQVGALQACDGGTLFLDEIDRVPLPIQDRLLDWLRRGGVRPIGAQHSFRVDVRLIASSDLPLGELAASGAFMPELLESIASVTVALPALRARIGDIPALSRHFLARIGELPGLREIGITDGALALLAAYEWPGNVRQLHSVLFRAAVFCEGDALTPADFPQLSSRLSGLRQPASGSGSAPESAGITLYTIDGNLRPLEEIEGDVIRLAIGLYRGRMTEVARRLGIGRSTLYRKLSELGIDNAA